MEKPKIIATVAFTVISILLFAFYTFDRYTAQRTERFSAALSEGQRAMLSLTDRSTYLFESTDSYIRSIRGFYQKNGLGGLSDLINASKGSSFDPRKSVISINSTAGRIIFSTLPLNGRAVSVTDLDHFKYFSSHPNDEVYIEPTRKGVLTQRYQFRIIRPILSDGNFDGEILMMMSPDYFERYFAQLNLGTNSSLSIVTLDRKLIARYPEAPDELFGKPLEHLSLWHELDRSPSGVYRVESSIDGIMRTYIYQKLKGYPVVIALGIADRDIDAGLRTTLNNAIGQSVIFALAAIVFGVLILVILRSNTRLLQTQAQLIESRERLEFATEGADIGVWDFDPATHADYWNEPMCRLYGLPKGSTGPGYHGWRSFLHPDDAERAHNDVAAALRGEKPFDSEFRIVLGDGTVRHVRSCGQVIRDATGRACRMLGISYDLSDMKKIEADLREASEAAQQANRAKSIFLANMSHEVRTPITSVTSVIDLIRQTYLTDEQQGYVKTLSHSMESILTIINDILDFSKIEAGRLDIETVDFDLRAAVHNVYELYQGAGSAKAVTLVLEGIESLPVAAAGDPMRLRQILHNLISNAIKFTEHGTVTIRTAIEAATGPRFILSIDICDSGIGMSPGQIERIFEPFSQADASTTRKFGGTGLGLAIVKRLVQLMGGTIEVTSTPAVGSCFRVRLPLETLPPERQLAAHPVGGKPSAPIRLAPLRLLLAEDNLVNQRLIKAMLGKLGHLVSVAANGKEAVAEVANGDFDAVLMDMQMPEMDGEQATAIIRAMPAPRSRVPIIALTADVMVEHRERYLKAGVNDLVAKPIDWDTLTLALAQATGNKSSQSGSPGGGMAPAA